MRYGSVCSGIEAASVAWEPLGWEPAWFAEIERFPSEILKHHWPHVKNFGDMTRLASIIELGGAESPDVLVGGTPCQAFSVAGSRKSLDDHRGQLTLAYVDILNAIDKVREEDGQPAAIAVWENVPGVLSTKDNAFGCFLAALAGEDTPLQPPGKRWPDSGCVFGPQRAIAWRVLDAQYFGLAQRRRRVFVVASARDGFHPAQVFLEREGVRRDSAPSREAGEEATAGTLRSTDGGSDVDHARAGQLRAVIGAYGGNNQSGPIEVATARNASASASGRLDFESETFVVHGTQDPCVMLDTAFALGRNTGQENAIFAIQAGALRQNPNSGPDGVGVQPDIAYTIEARAEVQAVCVTGDITHTLKAEGFDASEDGTGRGQPIVPTYGIPGNWIGRAPENGGNAVELMLDVSPCQTRADRHAVAYSFDSLASNSMKSSNPNSGCRETDIAAWAENSRAELRYENGDGSIVGSLKTGGGKPGQSYPVAQVGMTVRRLTPMECERLQGFPDGHTLLPNRDVDGPRYKAIGNSKAVTVVRWLGRRINLALSNPWKVDEL